MKVCKKCLLGRGLDQFYTNGKTPNGTQKYKPKCKSCELESQKARFWDIVEEFYGELKCSECGYDKCRSALEMHHRDTHSKDYEPSKLKTHSKATIVAELKKCDLLCCRCHREAHFL